MRSLLPVLLAVTLAVPAAAAGAPRCPLVADETGDVAFDGTGDLTGAVLYDPALDIVSADIATDDRTLTVVVRVVDLDAGPLPHERTYDLRFTSVPRFRIYATRAQPPTAEVLLVHSEELVEDPVTPAVAVFDDARNEVRITALLEPLRRYARLARGTYLGQLKSVTYARVVPSGGFSYRADTAHGTRSYRMGDPMCVARPR